MTYIILASKNLTQLYLIIKLAKIGTTITIISSTNEEKALIFDHIEEKAVIFDYKIITQLSFGHSKV